MDRTTPRQLELLRVLADYKARYGVAPSHRELQKAAGIGSPVTLVAYLDALENAGYIERFPGARNIVIKRMPGSSTAVDSSATRNVPLVGQVAAGFPILAEENHIETFAVAERLAKRPHNYFFLRVVGNSMDLAGINDGDLALVRQQSTARAGENVVALLDDSATIKKYKPAGNVVILEPVSSDTVKNRPIVVDTDFQIQGVVVASFPESSLRQKGE